MDPPFRHLGCTRFPGRAPLSGFDDEGRGVQMLDRRTPHRSRRRSQTRTKPCPADPGAAIGDADERRDAIRNCADDGEDRSARWRRHRLRGDPMRGAVPATAAGAT